MWAWCPFVKLQKSCLAAVANLKIGPPAAVPILYHRRPHPHILPLATPPSLPISPQLIKSNHRRRLGPLLTHWLTAWTLTPKMRAMALRELPS